MALRAIRPGEARLIPVTAPIEPLSVMGHRLDGCEVRVTYGACAGRFAVVVTGHACLHDGEILDSRGRDPFQVLMAGCAGL